MSFFEFCYAEGSIAACHYAECHGATKTLSITIIKYNIQNRDTNQLPNAVMFCILIQIVALLSVVMLVVVEPSFFARTIFIILQHNNNSVQHS
jgi:hypothetical protein